MKKTKFATAFAAGMVLVAYATPGAAAYNFCFGPTILRSVPNPDLTDGIIEADNGWLNATTYNGGDGAPDPDIILRGNKFTASNSHNIIALGVTVLNDTMFDAGDAIVILYQQGAQYGSLEIAPLSNDIAGAYPVNSGSAKFRTSTTGASGTWIDQGGKPAWLSWGTTATAGGGPCTASQPGTSCAWRVEIGIDSTAGGPSSFDKFYVDVVRFYRVGATAQSNQFSWPPNNTLVDATDSTITPDVSTWGGASVGSTTLCKGVNFGYADISAAPLDVSGNLKVNVSETLMVKLHNSGADAPGVIANFSHAPFGLCGLVDSCFQPIGATSTPVSCGNGNAAPNCCVGAGACIPPDPGNAGTALTVNWTPQPSDVPSGQTAAHHCFRVKLESTVSGTTFVNQGDFHNMWIDKANSPVAVSATLNMKGVPAPALGKPIRVRLGTQRSTQYAYADGSLPDVPVGQLTSQVVVQYHGSRFTGKYVTVAGHKSEVWEPIGAYAYTVQHPLEADFQKSFEERHSKLITSMTDGVKNRVEPLRRLNQALAKDPERPADTDWQARVENATVVPNSGDNVLEVAVNPDRAVTLPTTINFVKSGSGGKCQTFFCCNRGVGTAASASTMAWLFAIGAVVLRRRRRG